MVCLKENASLSTSHRDILEKVNSLENILEDMSMAGLNSQPHRQAQTVLPNQNEKQYHTTEQTGFLAKIIAKKSKTNEFMIETRDGYTAVDSDLCSSELSDIVEVPEEEHAEEEVLNVEPVLMA